MDQRVVDIRNSNWVHIIQDRQESGLSIKKWCAQNHIGEGSYYYHLHKLRMLALEDSGSQKKESMELLEPPAPVAANAFVPVAVNGDAESHDGVSLRVTRGDLVIEVSNDASDGILSLVREVMVHAS